MKENKNGVEEEKKEKEMRERKEEIGDEAEAESRGPCANLHERTWVMLCKWSSLIA